jgi:type III restriction enzyme
MQILNSHLENILLEFTATIDLINENIVEKYIDKIIYKYDLKQFRLD